MESFGGRSGGDNPAAICEDLAAHDVRAPLWWSVVDGTVPVPSGAVPVVVGSQEWVEALRTSRVIVTNDHLPDWFSKREGQHLLQTWHGTPMPPRDPSVCATSGSWPVRFPSGTCCWLRTGRPNSV